MRLGGALLAVAFLSACSGETSKQGDSFLPDAEDVGALAVAPDGALLWASRNSGELNRTVIEKDETTTETLGLIPVAGSGRRGVLGLAVSPTGAIFTSYTSPDGANPLVVAELVGANLRNVWQGPASTDQGTGGRIAFAPDGRLTLGIGSLSDEASKNDLGAISGKIISLDPAGSPGQQPQIIASGWLDPRGLTYLEDGSLWVADSPEQGPQRIARVDPAGQAADVLTLPEDRRIADLERIGSTGFFACDSGSNRLEKFTVTPGVPPAMEETQVDNCTRDLITLADRRIAYASSDGGIRTKAL